MSEGERRCPVCGTGMTRTDVHTISVDVCKQHGLWLDRGELSAITGILRGNDGAAKDKELRAAMREGKVDGAMWGWFSLLFD